MWETPSDYQSCSTLCSWAAGLCFLPGEALISSVVFYGQVHPGGDPGQTQDTLERSGLTAGLGIPLHSKRIWWKWRDQGCLGLPHYPTDWDQDERMENKVGKDEFLVLLLVLFLQNGSSKQFDSLSDVFGLLCKSLHWKKSCSLLGSFCDTLWNSSRTL